MNVYNNHCSTALTGLLLFTLVFSIHAGSGLTVNTDSLWSIYVAHSIVHEGNTDLNEFRERIKAHQKYGVRIRDGRVYPFFPIGPSLLAVPFVIILEKLPDLLNVIATKEDLQRINSSAASCEKLPVAAEQDCEKSPVLIAYRSVERLVASTCVSLCAVALYLIALMFLPQFHAVLLALIFAFCTPAWSTASRGLWQHGPSMVMLALSLLFLLQGRTREKFVIYAAVHLALSFLMRPTNLIPLVLLGIYAVFFYRRFAPKFLVLLFLTLAPFFALNFYLYDNLLPPYYRSGRIHITGNFLNALLTNLVSPNRGIFIYSPILLLSLYGIWLAMKDRGCTRLDLIVALCIFSHLAAISTAAHWWGGHSFGPRYMSDALPFLIYFLIPVFTKFGTWPPLKAQSAWCITALLIALSFSINLRGATKQSTLNWNVVPQNVDERPERVWDWGDLQFLR